jgi:hypothetical protein
MGFTHTKTHLVSGDQRKVAVLGSEADQLIGHVLIKSLSSFKQNEIAPLSSSILYNSSSKKEAVVERQ